MKGFLGRSWDIDTQQKLRLPSPGVCWYNLSGAHTARSKFLSCQLPVMGTSHLELCISPSWECISKSVWTKLWLSVLLILFYLMLLRREAGRYYNQLWSQTLQIANWWATQRRLFFFLMSLGKFYSLTPLSEKGLASCISPRRNAMAIGGGVGGDVWRELSALANQCSWCIVSINPWVPVLADWGMARRDS